MFYYEEVFRSFNKAKVDYVVLGGVAAVLYGVHRTTMDLDILVDMTSSNIDKFWNLLHKMGYRPKVAVTVEDFKKEENRKFWQKAKNMPFFAKYLSCLASQGYPPKLNTKVIQRRWMEVFSFIHPKDNFKIIDILIKDYLQYNQVKKEFIRLGRIKVPVLSLAQLKKLKKIAGRNKDLADLDDLRRLEKLTQ